jgi:formylglycine-generating enzyme
MDTKAEVFISYARGDQNTEEGKKRQLIVDKILNELKEKGYKVLIDFEQITFKDSIKSFMQNLGKAKYIIIILSDKYLKSQWCMKEVVMMVDYPDFRERIFPIVLDDAKIYDATGRADYVIYWQDQIKILEERIGRITDTGVAIPILLELNDYRKIHRLIADFAETLGFMNVLNAEEHITTNFKALIEAIENYVPTENYDELKRKFDILEKKFSELKEENESNIKLNVEELDKLKNDYERKIIELNTEIEDLKAKIKSAEIKKIELETKIHENESEQEPEQEEETLPYNILKLEKDATSDEIQKQYSKLKKEYEKGVCMATIDMKNVYESELLKIEDAFNEVYSIVKEKEDIATQEAYDFLNIKPGVTSYGIEDSYKKLKENMNAALNSSNYNIVKAAKESSIKLETHYHYLYKLVHDKELEEEQRLLCITPKNMVFVNGGKFMMGDNHEVEVASFFIDKFPLLVKDFKEFCEESELPMPEPPPWGWHDDHPMVNITWIEAFIYSIWVGKRLPTEAEWEFAARGGVKSNKSIYSGSNKIDDVAWYKDNSNNITNPVALKKPNELGIFDMSGNVWEWCIDWYAEYGKSETVIINPTGPEEGTARVLRGGSSKVSKDYCTVTRRLFNLPNSFNEFWGVRFVKDYTEDKIEKE